MKLRRLLTTFVFAASASACSWLFGLDPQDYASGGDASASPSNAVLEGGKDDGAPPTNDKPDGAGRGLHLYVLGGSVPLGGSLQNTIPTDKVYFAPISATDGSVGTFRETTRLPVPIRSHAAIAFADHIYVLGGETNQEAQTDAVYVAPIQPDGQVGGWVLAGSRLTSARKLHAAVVTTAAAAGRVFVLGGLGAAGRFGDVIAADLANGTTGPFAEVAQLDAPTFALAAAVRGDRLYALGGLNDDSTSTRSTTLSFTIAPDGKVSTGQPAAPLLAGGACYHGAGVIGDSLFTIGAVKNGITTVTSEVSVATLDGQGHVSSFQASTPLPVALWSHAVTVAVGRVYVTGGLGPNAKPRYDHILIGAPEGVPGAGGAGGGLRWTESPTRLPQSLAAHGAVIH